MRADAAEEEENEPVRAETTGESSPIEISAVKHLKYDDN